MWRFNIGVTQNVTPALCNLRYMYSSANRMGTAWNISDIAPHNDTAQNTREGFIHYITLYIGGGPDTARTQVPPPPSPIGRGSELRTASDSFKSS